MDSSTFPSVLTKALLRGQLLAFSKQNVLSNGALQWLLAVVEVFRKQRLILLYIS